jgi:tryptophan-rich sensory protein
MNFVHLAISIIICEAAGFLGSFFTAPAIPTWYAGLQKPSFSPPNWVFAPVWLILYALMGVSAYFVWKMGIEKNEVRIGLAIFAIQLILNVFWSYFFFKMQSPRYALIEIIILWLFILLTIFSFLKISRLAGFLLLPYLLWVSFAALLNFFILKLN